MAADPLLQSYLQITEETDRIMGLSEPPAPPVAAPAPAPAPVAALSAAAAPARRRAQRRKRPRALGPGRREKLASLVARQREGSLSLGDETDNRENEDPEPVAIEPELSADLLSSAPPDAVADGRLREGQTSALTAARDARMVLKHQGFCNAAEAFAFADTDRDGLLAAPAVSEWLHELGLQPATRALVLELLGRGRVRDGCIDARQWLRVFNHPSWGRLPSQDTALRAVAEAAAPIGRATIRERVDTRSAIFERRAALESVGQSFKLEIEETKAVSYAADFMTESDLLLGAEAKLDSGAVLNLAARECALRGLDAAADAFWFFADSVDGGAGGQARINAQRRPPTDPPPLREENLARGLAALHITSVVPFELLYALTEHEGGRTVVEPPTFLQQWGGSDGSNTAQKKMHPFAVAKSLTSAGRPTRRATVRAAVRKAHELVASGEVVLPTADDLLGEAKQVADAAESLREEVEIAAATADGAAVKVVEEAYVAAQIEVKDKAAAPGHSSTNSAVDSDNDRKSKDTTDVTVDDQDWRASSPPVWLVVPAQQDQFLGDPIFAPYDPAEHEAQRLAEKERSAQILAQGGAVGAVRIRRRQGHELLAQLRTELKKRGFKDAAEAFLFFDDNTNEVLVLIDFRRAYRRLDLDRLMSVEDAFLAIEDPHHQCGATRFIKALSWGKRGVPRSIPGALKRAEKRRPKMEERVRKAMEKIRSEQQSGDASQLLEERRKAAAAQRRELRRAGQNAIRIAREGLQERGFTDCAEAFTFFDTAGVDGGSFLSHVELELGFRNLRLVDPAAGAKDPTRGAKSNETQSTVEDEDDDEQDNDDDDQAKREYLSLHELRMALEVGGLFDGQTSYTEFVRHLEWGPLRHKTLHEQNAALDEAMVRRKTIRARAMGQIAEEAAARQAVLDARIHAAGLSRSLAKQAFSVAELQGDGTQSAALLRSAAEKIVPDAAVRCTHVDAAKLFDSLLDTMDRVADILLKKHTGDNLPIEQTAESAAREKEDAAQATETADEVFKVLKEIPRVCDLVRGLDKNRAVEGSEAAETLPSTPETLEAVSKLEGWKMITHAGAGLFRYRLTQARIIAAGERAVTIAVRAQARAAASPTRTGQEPAKELAMRTWKVALEMDPRNSMAIEELPAAKVAWQEVLAVRAQEQEEKSASDLANTWIDMSGMTDYGFLDTEERREIPEGSETAAKMNAPGKSESQIRDKPTALQPKPPQGSKPKASVAGEVEFMGT